MRQQYMAEGTAWGYENQLEHDAVLKWVIEKQRFWEKSFDGD